MCRNKIPDPRKKPYGRSIKEERGCITIDYLTHGKKGNSTSAIRFPHVVKKKHRRRVELKGRSGSESPPAQ